MGRTTNATESGNKLVGPIDTICISDAIEEIAPDGSRVRPLLSLASGSMAQFELAPGQVSRSVMHHSVEELWLVTTGIGELWRQRDGYEKTVALAAGVCVSIPAGTAFQFRCIGNESLRIAAVTMPPWPGDGEAVRVGGRWK